MRPGAWDHSTKASRSRQGGRAGPSLGRGWPTAQFPVMPAKAGIKLSQGLDEIMGSRLRQMTRPPAGILSESALL
jgi:hypothetical protein